MGGRDEADVHRDRPLAADPLELTLLEHTRELDLSLGRQLGDLVQEQGPPVRQLEASDAALGRR